MRSRVKIKNHIIDAYGGKCQVCGYNKCRQAFDFHHISPLSKKFGINSALKNGHSITEIINELKICIMVCANCHREIEAGITPSCLDCGLSENALQDLEKNILRGK